MEEDHPDVVFSGLGHETICAVFMPLLHGPPIDIHFRDGIELDDLELPQDVTANIQGRARTIFVENQTKSLKALQSANRQFWKLYK